MSNIAELCIISKIAYSAENTINYLCKMINDNAELELKEVKFRFLLNSEVSNFTQEKVKFDMTGLIYSLFEKHKRVGSFPIRKYWLSIGREEDCIKANGI